MKNIFVVMIMMAIVMCGLAACQSGHVKRISSSVRPVTNGATVEQANVKKRLEMENLPGAVQYLYVLNSYTGQVMFSDVAAGKVTSSGKRLCASYGNSWECIGEDGTYGQSVPYIFWFSSINGAYRQLFMTGGQQVIVTSQPLSIKNMTLQVEEVK